MLAELRVDMAVVRMLYFRRFRMSHVFGRRTSSHKATRNGLLEKMISDRRVWLRTLKCSKKSAPLRCDKSSGSNSTAFDALLGCDQVLPVDAAAAGRAKEIVMGHRQMSAT